MKYEFSTSADAAVKVVLGSDTLKKGIVRLEPGKSELTFLLGLGDEEKLSTAAVREAFYKAAGHFQNYGVRSLFLENLSDPSYIAAAYEGLWAGNYVFTRYKEDKQAEQRLQTVCVAKSEGAEEALAQSQVLLESADFTRYLVNSTAIDLYPQTLAQLAKEELEPLGVEVVVYGREEIEKFGLKAFLTVSLGSDKEPQLIVAKYTGAGDAPYGALVGKGLTYDSGGYDIKPGAGMRTMHGDMAGSATVLGAIRAVAAAKLEKNVIVVVAACENMINGSAYKNGDIIPTHLGKTVEIITTDAEGRLTLADALSFTEAEYSPSYIVDAATLTGAVVIALGDVAAGAVTSSPELMADVLAASRAADEPVWELPSFPAYNEQIEATFADLKNSGGRGAGAITAGLFLKEFVGETPWVHLDIAGTSYRDKGKAPYPAGASAFGVKTLYELVKNRG